MTIDSQLGVGYLRLHLSTEYFFRALNVVGLIFVYCALFLYEGREGQIQNKIEEWWVRVDDARIVAHSRATAFLRAVARLTVMGFNRVLGERLISLRFVGVSFCLSVASIFLMAFFGAVRTHRPAGGELFRSAFCITFALLPGLDGRRWVRRLWGLSLLVVALSPATSGFLLFTYLTRGAYFAGRLVGYAALAFLVSFIFDVSYVALTRWMLLKVSAGGRGYAVALLVAANFSILCLLLLGPLFLGVWVSRYWPGGGATIALSFFLNAIDLFAGSAAFLLGLALLIHRFIWPLVERPLYALQRYGVIGNKKLLWGLGVALTLIPTHTTFGVLRLLIEKLAGAVGG